MTLFKMRRKSLISADITHNLTFKNSYVLTFSYNMLCVLFLPCSAFCWITFLDKEIQTQEPSVSLVLAVSDLLVSFSCSVSSCTPWREADMVSCLHIHCHACFGLDIHFEGGYWVLFLFLFYYIIVIIIL